jgi:hypothetical protein
MQVKDMPQKVLLLAIVVIVKKVTESNRVKIKPGRPEKGFLRIRLKVDILYLSDLSFSAN